MRTLEFIVDKQRLKKNPDCDFSMIVAGSVGYLRAKFEFSEEWSGYKKAASFWLNGEEHGALLDADNTCEIPPEALKGEVFGVSVTGMDESGRLIPTSKIKVTQEVQ